MRWRGVVSILWLLLSWAALDDIATDNADSFPLEYSALMLAGVWFTALGAWLIVKQRTVAGICSLLAVALGIVACWSLPHHYQPPSWINSLGYVTLAWFVGIALWLVSGGAPRAARSA